MMSTIRTHVLGLCVLGLAGPFSGVPACGEHDAQLRSSFPSPPVAQADAGGERAALGQVVLPSGQSVADVAARVTPSVVNVFSERRQTSNRAPVPFFGDPLFDFFFRGRTPRELPSEPPSREQSLGSGVIVGSDGIIITNHHVVAEAGKIRVGLQDGRELDAKLVGSDPKSDIAVLRVAEKGLPAIAIADSSQLRIGDLVLAVGNPFGLGQTVTMGIISAVGRANMGITEYEDFIQTDAAINPGNSGGALVTMAGKLAGINTAIVSRSGGYQGIGFAIPSNMALQVKEAILRDGRVIRGYLGVNIQDLTPELARALGVEKGAGVLISDVRSESPAARAGIERGDVIVAMNGTKPKDAGHLRRLVAEAGKGKKVTFELLRGDKRRSVEVTLGELPSEDAAEQMPAHGDGVDVLEGLAVRDLDAAARAELELPAQLEGVVVTHVAPNSPAASAGLLRGDVILEVNRRATGSRAAFERALTLERERALLLVYRDGATRYVLVTRE